MRNRFLSTEQYLFDERHGAYTNALSTVKDFLHRRLVFALNLGLGVAPGRYIWDDLAIFGVETGMLGLNGWFPGFGRSVALVRLV